MNNMTDLQYLELCNELLEIGKRKKNRTGVDTIGLFGAQMRFHLSFGFPILTTKKVNFKAVVHELLWFISGSTNIKYLVDNGVNIWNGDAYRYHRKTVGTIDYANEQEFIDAIKTNKINPFGPTPKGNLGFGTYGSMWREYPDIVPYKCVDQLARVLNTLENDPDNRRMIVTAWHPALVDQIALPPCHVMFQFHTEELTPEERMRIYAPNQSRIFIEQEAVDQWTKTFDSFDIPKRRLNLQMYQRSADMFLGVPFNISSYALLLCLVGHCVNMLPGIFIHSLGDYHIYENHIPQVNEQMRRDYKKLPTLKINATHRDLSQIKFEEIELIGYESHEAIKGTVNTDDVTA